MDDTEIPDDHPVAPYADDLETHADHLEAYGEILAEADPDEIDGAMLVLWSEDSVDTLPTLSDRANPRSVSLWMLGAHIHHVASGAQSAGGNVTMAEVARDAIQFARSSDPLDGGHDV